MIREDYVSGLRKEVAGMNKEMLHRMKIAGEYQRKAIHALFPEEMSEHLDVIEKEIRMMVMEAATEWMTDFCKSDSDRNTKENREKATIKKVDIL